MLYCIAIDIQLMIKYVDRVIINIIDMYNNFYI